MGGPGGRSRWRCGRGRAGTLRPTPSRRAEAAMMRRGAGPRRDEHRHWQRIRCAAGRRGHGSCPSRAGPWGRPSGSDGGALGRRADGPLLVCLALARNNVPVAPGQRLFLPETWTVDADRRAKPAYFKGIGRPGLKIQWQAQGKAAIAFPPAEQTLPMNPWRHVAWRQGAMRPPAAAHFAAPRGRPAEKPGLGDRRCSSGEHGQYPCNLMEGDAPGNGRQPSKPIKAGHLPADYGQRNSVFARLVRGSSTGGGACVPGQTSIP